MILINVRELRASLKMSRPDFADKFGFNLGTVRQWEYGRRSPTGPARVLLALIQHDPAFVIQAINTVAPRVVTVS